MFVIATTPTFTVPVRVDIIGDNNKTKTSIFKAKFLRLEQNEMDEMRDAINDKTMTDQQVVDKVLVGWEDVTDAAGQPVEFTPDNLTALLAIFPTRHSIVRTYFDTVSGSKRKN
ncbi:phage tail assembly chaperone [Undibacterium sp. TJN25]|uniref:phage tail assembly chaperone n=1 Tax=Undibacterium sp. TJN25 TaxID=3413056 RepID=UPI003BEF8A05